MIERSPFSRVAPGPTLSLQRWQALTMCGREI